MKNESTTKYSQKTTEEILDDLAVQIYEPPLAQLREHGYTPQIPEILRIIMLLVDFDTEVHMNGMLGFLENPPGFYLVETIEVLDMIGATTTAHILRKIQRIMQKYHVTPASLREDFVGAQAFQITTFSQLHGEALKEMAKEIQQEAKNLYVYHHDAEAVFDLLTTFVDARREQLVRILNQYGVA